MINKEKYIQNTFSYIFSKDINIRKKANEIEAILENLYMQPQINSIQDDIEPNYPRIIFRAKNGHSIISISQVSIILEIIYDENISLSEKIGYLKERCKLIEEIIDKSKVSLNFVGLATVVTIPTTQKESISIIQKKYMRENKVENYEDIGYRKTIIIDNKFYSNISIENYKEWEDLNYFGEVVKMPNKNIKECGIKLFVDLNDRYSFNENESYLSNIKITEEIIKKSFEIVRDEVVFLKEEV